MGERWWDGTLDDRMLTVISIEIEALLAFLDTNHPTGPIALPVAYSGTRDLNVIKVSIGQSDTSYYQLTVDRMLFVLYLMVRYLPLIAKFMGCKSLHPYISCEFFGNLYINRIKACVVQSVNLH